MPLDMALMWLAKVVGWSGSDGSSSEDSIYGGFDPISCFLDV